MRATQCYVNKNEVADLTWSAASHRSPHLHNVSTISWPLRFVLGRVAGEIAHIGLPCACWRLTRT